MAHGYNKKDDIRNYIDYGVLDGLRSEYKRKIISAIEEKVVDRYEAFQNKWTEQFKKNTRRNPNMARYNKQSSKQNNQRLAQTLRDERNYNDTKKLMDYAFFKEVNANIAKEISKQKEYLKRLELLKDIDMGKNIDIQKINDAECDSEEDSEDEEMTDRVLMKEYMSIEKGRKNKK